MYKVDTVVVGAGIVGLSIARSLAMRGHEVLVLECEEAVGLATSSRNSEVIHAGLYYAPGSLKARLCVEGRRALYTYCAERAIAHRRCGKLVVATTPDENNALQELFERATANGVEDIRLVGVEELATLEPALRGTAALLSETTGIFDAREVMLAYQADAENAGATVQCRTPLTAGRLYRSSIIVRAGSNEQIELEAKLVINAAGLGAWDVSWRLDGLDQATIPPRYYAKGSYFSFAGRPPFSRLVYPVPMQTGLGIHLTFDLGGQARFGPDVEWVEAIDYCVDPSRSDKFYNAIRHYWPDLPDGTLAPDYAGVRPRTRRAGERTGDFVIQGPAATGHKGYVALYGIESPGLTASLAIGTYVADLVSEADDGIRPGLS